MGKVLESITDKGYPQKVGNAHFFLRPIRFLLFTGIC